MNCDRCGIEVDITVIQKRQTRGSTNKNCQDCNYRKKKESDCKPWTGEVDDNWNPIDNYDRLYLPGLRTCGHKDCVNPKHIEQLRMAG
jgi:hypothetical protein